MSGENKKKKILLIGFGRFGKVLHGALRACGADVDVATKNYATFLTNSEIDLAVIATPVATHVQIAKDCLTAGKNVFVEKPLSPNPDEVTKVFELAKQKGRSVYVDEVALWHAEYMQLARLLRGNVITSISCAFQKYGTFDDTIFNAHVYHDLYVLADLVGEGEAHGIEIVSAKDPIEKGRVDTMAFRFRYNNVAVEGRYDRLSEKRHKEIVVQCENGSVLTWRNGELLKNDVPEEVHLHDALQAMLQPVLEGTADYAGNNKRALQATQLLGALEGAVLRYRS
mgnify:CR=1 FL=1